MDLARYHRQMLLPGFGEAGQRKLRQAHALVVGCGALGSVIIDSLARAGVGTLTIVDRDIIELTNLQRQILYDETDVERGMPKAEAAKRRVAQINSAVKVNAHVDDFSHRNAARFIEGIDILLDGLDNFETRYLLNDLAVMRGIPYVYGGAVGTTGVSMTILPHHATRQVDSTSKVIWTQEQSTPCLRCVFPEAPPPGTTPTCDTAGVLGPVVSIIASHQSVQALKLMTGNVNAVDRSLLSIDGWSNEIRQFDVSGARDGVTCPCCAQGKFEHFEGAPASATLSLCGRNAVQISPASDADLNLAEFTLRLASHGDFTHNAFLMRGELKSERGSNGQPIEITLFPNGRAIIKGVSQPEAARSIYAKYIGA
jgi:molybdopterin-synthase adenylyltransferase